jgi:hypothetical protein
MSEKRYENIMRKLKVLKGLMSILFFGTLGVLLIAVATKIVLNFLINA